MDVCTRYDVLILSSCSVISFLHADGLPFGVFQRSALLHGDWPLGPARLINGLLYAPSSTVATCWCCVCPQRPTSFVFFTPISWGALKCGGCNNQSRSTARVLLGRHRKRLRLKLCASGAPPRVAPPRWVGAENDGFS